MKFDPKSKDRLLPLLGEAVVVTWLGSVKCSRSQHPFMQAVIDSARPMPKIQGFVPLNQQWSLREMYNLEMTQHICVNCGVTRCNGWHLKDALAPGLGSRCVACYKWWVRYNEEWPIHIVHRHARLQAGTHLCDCCALVPESGKKSLTWSEEMGMWLCPFCLKWTQDRDGELPPNEALDKVLAEPPAPARTCQTKPKEDCICATCNKSFQRTLPIIPDCDGRVRCNDHSRDFKRDRARLVKAIAEGRLKHNGRKWTSIEQFETEKSKYATRKYPVPATTTPPQKGQKCAACNKALAKDWWGRLDPDDKPRCNACSRKYKEHRQKILESKSRRKYLTIAALDEDFSKFG